MNKNRLIPALLLLLIALVTISSAQTGPDEDNPFSQQQGFNIEEDENESALTPIKITEKSAEKISLPFWREYISWQKSINRTLSAAMLDLHENFSPWKVVLILAVSFFYSMVHTAGPGHGKAILGTYFLTSEKKHTVNDAVKAGVIVSLTHIGTAFILSLIFFLVLNSITEGMQSGAVGEKASFYGGFMVILTGMMILLTQIPAVGKWADSIKLPRCLHGRKNGSLIWFAVLSGIVPCPLAWFVLIFSISYGMYGYGIVAVAAMALGAAVTIGGIGAAVIHGKSKGMKFLSEAQIGNVSGIIRTFGGFVLVFLGSSMSLF